MYFLNRKYLMLVLATCLMNGGAVLPGLAETDSDDKDPKLPPGYVMSYDGPVSGNSTADYLALAAQYMVNHQYYDRAITVCQRALRKNYEDADIHKIYAEALEGKLRAERKDNPALFEACLKEWLIVARNRSGDEKGATLFGVGIPGLMHAYEDEDHGKDARGHLRELTGTAPRPWETDGTFIKRVMKDNASTHVSGRLMDKNFAAPANARVMPEPDTDRGRTTMPAAPKGDPLDWLKQ